MAKKKQRPAMPGARAMHDAWLAAWKQTDQRNPFAHSVDVALAAAGKPFSTFDVKMVLALITSKREHTQWERALHTLHKRMMHTREQILADRVQDSVPGQMFLLKAQFGYKEGIDVNMSHEQKETVVVYGQE